MQLDHALAVSPLLELRRVVLRVGVAGGAASVEVERARDIVLRMVGVREARRLLASAERRLRNQVLGVTSATRMFCASFVANVVN